MSVSTQPRNGSAATIPELTKSLPQDEQAMQSLVHDALAAEEERQEIFGESHVTPADLRRSARKKFSCIQLIAPYDGRRMPSQAEFQSQLCHDLSPAGFSFWLQSPVTASHLIVALGEVPFLFMIAEIVRQEYEPQGEPGAWRIGCRFIRRVER